MSPATAAVPVDEPLLPFPSLSALRSAHSDLLKGQPAGGTTPGFVSAVESFLLRGQETGALLDSPDDRWSAQSALDYWASALYRLGRQDVDPTLAEFDPGLAPELDDSLCPYVGLEAFRENDHERFFGRTRLIGEMLARLQEVRLLAALGPSGSGKSSVVLGGLLSALKSGALPGSEGWRYLPPMVPGLEPLKNLARALQPDETDPAKWASRAERLAKDPEHLARLAVEPGDRPVVLVIDQFEEVFTLCEDSRAREGFIAGLLSLLLTPEPRHLVILTMRSDYETFVARQQNLQPFFERGQLRVTPLSAAEMRDAIEKPAERVGLKFEDGVVPALLEDILGEPAGLPLLQFTLLKLWEERERNRVTWAAYRKLGGGRLALARSADALYDGLIPEEQVTARRILLRMVRPGSGLEVTSSRVRRESLDRSGEDPGRVDRVLKKLVAARLVRLTPGETPADAQVEVAHEALVRNWPRLVDWLEEMRVEITARRRLETRATEWVGLGRGQSGLLDEAQLLEAERWLASPEAAEIGYDEQLAAFVQASRAAVDQDARQKRRKALFRWGALIAVALYFAGWAVFAWQVKQTELVTKAKQDLTNLRSKMTDLSMAEAKLRADLNRLQEAASSDQQKAVQAALQAEQARENMQTALQKARAADEKARAAERTAQEALARARVKEEEAAKQQRTAAQISEAANKALAAAEQTERDAREKLAVTRTAIKDASDRLTELEALRQAAEERRKELEGELADGGGIKEETLSGALERTQEVIRSEFEQYKFRKRRRPVQIGIGTSSWQKGSLDGTLCCLVRDTAGQEYLLSRSSVFSSRGTLIVQPSRRDGGTDRKKHVIAEVVQVGQHPHRSGAIAKLLPGVQVDPVIPDLGRIEGIAEGVTAGTEVRSFGRGSGKQKGKVLRIEKDGTIVTNIIPAAGDSGGPVLTPDRKIVGMLWGWTQRGKESYVTPIRQILDELGVELVVR